MVKGVFEGVKVLDFTWVGVGPLTMKYLADHGATVVRVESMKRPDTVRIAPPYKDKIAGVDRSGYYAFLNSNKYSIALDLRNPERIDMAKRLASWADIVAESFEAGTMEQLGLGYEDLRKVKSDVIMYRACNQGQTGPHAKFPGYGTQLVGLAGFTYLTGWPDRAPVQPFGAYTDIAAFPFGGSALIAALIHHRKTGEGQCIDLSQFEAGVQFLSPLLLDYMVNERMAEREGNLCPYAAPHGIYRCKGKDRWCAITVFTDEEWAVFCQVIDTPEWTRTLKFTTLLKRKESEDELNKLVEEWTSNFTAEEVMTLMQDAGIAAGVVKTAEEVRNDPQLNERGLFWILNHREIGPYAHVGQPFKLSKTPAQPRMAAPCLGEHTEYICKEILNMSDEEFIELLSADVFK